ncbi:uncharacterized protein V6R79_010074 [Siganus canaliculatus]
MSERSASAAAAGSCAAAGGEDTDAEKDEQEVEEGAVEGSAETESKSERHEKKESSDEEKSEQPAEGKRKAKVKHTLPSGTGLCSGDKVQEEPKGQEQHPQKVAADIAVCRFRTPAEAQDVISGAPSAMNIPGKYYEWLRNHSVVYNVLVPDVELILSLA